MSGQIVISGSLSFLSLGDVLQLIGSNGGTGVLRIISKYSPEPGFIWFSKGNIINASTPSQTGLDAAYALFGWIEGEYEFSREEVNVKKEIHTNRMEIILDGLRMVDEGEIPKLGPISFERQAEETDKSPAIPVIKGPLADYMYVVNEEEYTTGRKIVQENSYGSWVWVILEGMVDIVRDTPQGPLLILRLGAGAFIGTLTSFSFQNTIRTASAVAVDNVILGVLDSQKLSKEFTDMSSEFKEVLFSLERRRKQVTDRTVDLYLKKDVLKEIAKDKKDVLIKQGTEYNDICTIKLGEAVVIRKTKEGFVPLCNLGMGDFIGRIPFLDIGHEPHSASVIVPKSDSGEPFEKTPLNADALQKEYDRLSLTLKNMIESVATCVTVTTRLACEFHKKNVQKK